MTGEELRQRRLAAGLTQTKLARLAAVQPFTIGRYERGTRSLSIAMDRFLRLVIARYIASKNRRAREGAWWQSEHNAQPQPIPDTRTVSPAAPNASNSTSPEGDNSQTRR